MARDHDIAWAAGFFDGEGCISISYHKHRRNYMLGITAFQTITDAPLELLQDLFGGSVRIRPPATKTKNQGWLWAQWGANTIPTLGEMLPYLRVKKEQAKVAIAFQNRKVAIGGKYEHPEAAYILEHKDYLRLRELKRKVV